jgi:hypothetical protein
MMVLSFLASPVQAATVSYPYVWTLSVDITAAPTTFSPYGYGYFAEYQQQTIVDGVLTKITYADIQYQVYAGAPIGPYNPNVTPVYSVVVSPAHQSISFLVTPESDHISLVRVGTTCCVIAPSFNAITTLTMTPLTPVPLPATALLFLSALAGLGLSSVKRARLPDH